MPNSPSNRLTALLGLMPFSEVLGMNLETADRAGWLAPSPGRRSDVPAMGSSMAVQS